MQGLWARSFGRAVGDFGAFGAGGAAQTSIRWGKQGVWERLLWLAQRRAGSIDLGMAFLDGANIRAHAEAAGASKKGGLDPNEMRVKRLDGSRLRRTAVAA